MGCSSSKELIKIKSENDSIEKDIKEPEDASNINNLQKKTSIYKSVLFTQNLLLNSNLLLYTAYSNTSSEFNSKIENNEPRLEKGTF